MNQLILVLSLSLCVLACATEEPIALPPAAEAPAPEPPAAAAPPAVAEPAPQVEVIAPAATPEALPAPAPAPATAPVAKPGQSQRPVAKGDAATLRLVAANGGCTRMRCPEHNRCCNTCRYGWRSAEATDPSAPLALSGVAVPEPVQKGCGVAFELELKGKYEGDSFVVASFKKVRPLKADAVASSAKPAQPPGPIARASKTLHAVAAPAACTEKKCPESNPCCNRCQYSAWQIKGGDSNSYLKLRGIAVPAPEQDGCGVAFDLELTGRSDGRYFFVESFKKLPPTKR